MRLPHAPRRPQRLAVAVTTASLLLVAAAPVAAADHPTGPPAEAGQGVAPGNQHIGRDTDAPSGDAPSDDAPSDDAPSAGAPAEVTVTSSDCVAVAVTSTKEISNVVLLFEDGDTERFEDLPGSLTGTFAGVDNAGETITTVWVKSGDNDSGDGPGYGEAFDLDCSPDEPVVEEPEQDDPDGDDPDGEDPEGEDPEEADEPQEDTPPAPITISDPLEELPVDEEDDAPDFDEEVLNTVEEDDPTEEEPQVLGVVEDRDETADAAPEQLPNTGADSTTALLAALASLALGASLLRRSRRLTT